MSDKSPAVHSVQFYEDHASLILRLRGISASSLRSGGSVLVVATKSHRDKLVKALQEVDVNVRSAAREGRFTMLDARETLEQFMRDGRPDPDLFANVMGAVLQQARSKARTEDHELTVFGEMVSLLWNEGKKSAALELEELWNHTLSGNAFHLHCAYPRWNFVDNNDDAGMATICHAHSHVFVQ